ncbi:MAG: hypothetical protein HAW62_02105 [Endozoicomonadaceae bacterium]|nr:hypothetical protein [Endozoicomonadaceae bacterium]
MADDLSSLSSTEEKLAQDIEGTFKKQLLDQFQNEINTLKNPNKSLLSKEEFSKKNSLIKALEDSIALIELTWKKYHVTQNQLH